MKTTNKPSGKTPRISAVVLIIFLTTQFMAAQWYDGNWLYRMPVAVPNTGLTELIDLQVQINLSTSNFDFTKALPDGKDIRITASDGITLIPFWIETFTTTSARIWVKVPSIPVTTGTTIFLYYGNFEATSISNGVLTFNFFDDFKSWPSTEPPSIWQSLASVPAPSADPAGAVYDNKLYTFGGYGIYQVILNAVYEFDPASGPAGLWTNKTPMPTDRWGAAAVEFDGKIYVFGGDVESELGSDANEIYDPETDAWTYRTVVNPLSIPDYDATGVVHPDVLYFPEGKDGYEYWMVYTPYPPEPEENPSIVRSHDGKNWTAEGISNPVIPEGADGTWNDFENPDPDFLYVAAYDKWFMVWDGGQTAYQSRRIALAYSDDGKTWTQYDGLSVNGNTNPVILSGRSIEDTHAAAWERDALGYSKTCTPTLFFENGTFYLFYGEESSGNNRGLIGLATFSWDNTDNNVVSLTRNPGNPIISLPEDAIFKSGGGHIDVSKNTGTNPNSYHMYVVRELVGSTITNKELALLTSTDLVNWTNQGKAIERGGEHQWDDTHIYRSCPVVNSSGEIVFFNGNIRIYYSGFHGENAIGIGLAEISPTGAVDKFSWEGSPKRMPSDISDQGIMGVRFGDKIHLFYQSFHYEYDPLTDTYRRRGDIPYPRTWGTCAVVGSEIYIIGGHGGSGGTNTNQVWVDTLNDVWEQRSPMPASLYGMGRENPVINGKIYVTHGWNNDYFRKTNYIYDPVTDIWAQKGPAIYPRDGVTCGVINNRLYVAGGRDLPVNPDGLTYNEVYDPEVDTWIYGPSQWNTSGSSYVFANNTARYQGSYGLTIRHTIDNPEEFQYAETVLGLGPTYALDFDWNVTSLDGISESGNNPQGFVRLTEEWEPAGNLYFYELGVPVVRWYTPPMAHLQNSTWDTWHKVSVVRNGTDSRVVFDGNIYSSGIITVTGGSGKIRFGAIRTTEYLDNVRVRKWAGFEPVLIPGSEQFQGTQWTGGGGDNNWNNPLNWSSGIPGSTVNANILNVTNYPMITVADAVCNNLIIDPSARITIEGGSVAVNGLLTINSFGTTNSGSLINNGTLLGNPTISYNRYLRPDADYGDYHFISSPVVSNTAANSSKVSAVYRYNEPTGTWPLITNMTLMESGIGYNIKQVVGSNGLITFTGALQTEEPLVKPASSPYSDVIGTEDDYEGRSYATGEGS